MKVNMPLAALHVQDRIPGVRICLCLAVAVAVTEPGTSQGTKCRQSGPSGMVRPGTGRQAVFGADDVLPDIEKTERRAVISRRTSETTRRCPLRQAGPPRRDS